MATGHIGKNPDTHQHVLSWTVGAHVGPGAPNHRSDVELVQFGYFCLAQIPVARPASFQAAIKAVQPGAPYHGAPQDPLTIAIREHQKDRGGVQDGRVSPIQRNDLMYADHKIWMIVALSNAMRIITAQTWPMLHRARNCPPALAEASRSLFWVG
jgi:hypothetical protein